MAAVPVYAEDGESADVHSVVRSFFKISLRNFSTIVTENVLQSLKFERFHQSNNFCNLCSHNRRILCGCICLRSIGRGCLSISFSVDVEEKKTIKACSTFQLFYSHFI